MSDYSNLKFEEVADIPNFSYSPTHAKPLAPSAIFNTLPFMKNLAVGQTFKFELPDDGFGYTMNTELPIESTDRYHSMKGALTRTFSILAKDNTLGNPLFVYRFRDGEMYIKRIG